MASIGEQIRDARKAKGLTQDGLAEAMNVSRQAVSHWETNRTMPDAETLIRLSKTLNYSFEAAYQTAAEAPEDKPEDRQEAAEQAVPVSPAAAAVKGSKIKPAHIIGAVVPVCAVLLVCLLLLPALTNKTSAKERAYKSPEGEIYTIARFRQEAANEAGKAYLRVNPSLSVSHGDNYDYWMWDVAYHEMNGAGCSIVRMEQVIFAREKENVEQIITAADFQAYGMAIDIPANGDWRYQGGLPVQDTVLGVGLLLRCSDENGAALAFTTYIPFSEN